MIPTLADTAEQQPLAPKGYHEPMPPPRQRLQSHFAVGLILLTAFLLVWVTFSLSSV
ncbi:MAG: hypothetical protein ACOVSW_06040 [Candidatus Kapaibacteriota bacterium]